MRCTVPLLTAALLTACAPSVSPVPAPVPGVQMQSWAVSVRDTAAKDIYIRNDGEEDVLITAIQLYGCKNLKQECKVYSPNVLLRAGNTVKAMRLEADNTKRAWKYRYNYATRSMTAARTPIAGKTSVVTGFSRIGMVPFVGLGNTEEFVARVPQLQGTAKCNPSGPGPAGFTTLMMVMIGDASSTPSLFFVDLDGAGMPSLYTEMRGNLRTAPGTPGSDSLPPRTTISVHVQQGIANLLNEGGGKPAEYYAVTGPAVMTSKALGNPAEMMARVIRECSK